MKADSSRLALVSGASRGIGRALALELAAQGWFVIGTARSRAGSEAITEALQGRGAGQELDVDDTDSVESGLEAIRRQFGAPSVLVNNAGIHHDSLLLRLAEKDWAKVLETNLHGPFRLIKSCLRDMVKARWGRIINISSVVASMGNPGQANYVAAKAGLEGLTRSLALELGPRGITVNCVAPGYIQTDMTAELNPEQQQRILQRVPLGRMGEVGEVAALVAFLASDQAAYITGATLPVNGGLHL